MEVKHVIIVTTGIIFNENNEVLICLRPLNKVLGGLWEFPGGKLDDGETLEECIARELKEELDLEVLVGSKMLVVKDDPNIELHAYKINAFEGIPKSKCHDEIKWVTVHELKEYDMPVADIPIVDLLLLEQ
jgi:mutator protein MutT